MARNKLFEKIISLEGDNRLTTNEVKKLKSIYEPDNVDVICACVANDIDSLEECIEKGCSLDICNDEVLRYTIYKGFTKVSRLLISEGIEV